MVSRENESTPHGLDLVIDYVNTRDLDEHTDEIATPAALGAWLSDRGLLPARARRVSEGEHAEAIRLREALRALMLAHNGEAADPRASGELERAARGGELGVHFDSDGTVSVRAARRGVAGALAALLAPIAESAADGSWGRAKACRAEDCQWAFYDRSRNRSGVWCNMAVCGNREKVRAYRTRRES